MEIEDDRNRKRNKEQAYLTDGGAPESKTKSISPEMQEEEKEEEEKEIQVLLQEVQEEIVTILQPQTADWADIVNFITSRASSGRQIWELTKVISGLMEPDEINMFAGLIIYRQKHTYNKLKEGKGKHKLTDGIKKEWIRFSSMKHQDREQIARTYRAEMQKIWLQKS